MRVAALLSFVVFVLFAPSWYRLYYRVRYGRRYVEEDSGR